MKSTVWIAATVAALIYWSGDNTPEPTNPAHVPESDPTTTPMPTSVDLEASNLSDGEITELVDAGYYSNPNDNGEILYSPEYVPETDGEITAFESNPKNPHKSPSNAERNAGRTIIEETVCKTTGSSGGYSWSHLYGLTSYPDPNTILIQVNECVIRADGGTDKDVLETWEHERAHAAGWEHGEGTPEVNAAYHA